MSQRILIWLTFVTLLAASGCTLPQSGGTTATPVRTEADDVTAINHLREQWLSAFKQKDSAAATGAYTADAAFISPNGTRVEGRPGIEDMYRQLMQTFDSDLTLQSRSRGTSGNLAFDSGEFQETMVARASGNRLKLHGQYLMVLKREPDGGWRISQHMWSESPPTNQR